MFLSSMRLLRRSRTATTSMRTLSLPTCGPLVGTRSPPLGMDQLNTGRNTSHWQRHFSSEKTNPNVVAQSFPPLAPKLLKDVMKLELIVDKTTEELREIWTKYFQGEDVRDSVGMVASKEEWELVEKRAHICPSFIVPVHSEENRANFYTLVTQFQPSSATQQSSASGAEYNTAVMTYLEDFKKDPNNAPVYFMLVAHKEFMHAKNIVLLQAMYLPFLTKAQAQNTMDSFVGSYLDDAKYNNVEIFNLRPEQFDFNSTFNL